MKIQYRLTFALCVIVLFTAGIAFGAADSMNNTTTANTTTANETNTNQTNATEIANGTENATPPVDTTVEPAETTDVASDAANEPENTDAVPVDVADEPVKETTEPEDPVSTPEQSPGFGIVVTIMVVLSAIYMGRKGR